MVHLSCKAKLGRLQIPYSFPQFLYDSQRGWLISLMKGKVGREGLSGGDEVKGSSDAWINGNFHEGVSSNNFHLPESTHPHSPSSQADVI